jgi:hypothetical protein
MELRADLFREKRILLVEDNPKYWLILNTAPPVQ